MALQIFHNGKEIESWTEVERFNIVYGCLSGCRLEPCDTAGLPAGEPKPVSLYNVPRECEKEDTINALSSY